MSNVMTKDHPQWPEFIVRLCNKILSPRDCDQTLRITKEILGEIGMDVDKSVKYLQGKGGFCDCEVIMNVEFGNSPEEEKPKMFKWIYALYRKLRYWFFSFRQDPKYLSRYDDKIDRVTDRAIKSRRDIVEMARKVNGTIG